MAILAGVACLGASIIPTEFWGVYSQNEEPCELMSVIF